MAQARGIWLLRAQYTATCLHHTQTLLDLCQELGGKHGKVGVDPSTGFQLRRLPVQLEDRSGPADPGLVVCSLGKVTVPQEPEIMLSPTVHVSDRSSHGDGETSVVGSPSHEAHPVALEEALACS